MKKTFYDNVATLDEYKGLQSPTKEQIRSLLEYLNFSEYVKYFFTDLENPVWIKPLHENGSFAKVPPVLEDPNNPGYFSLPAWYPGEYLKRMADKFPEVVKDVALSLVTDNSRAIYTMFEALLKIPVNITAETVSEFKRWMETPFAGSMMLSQELGNIMEYLTKGNQIEAALMVLEVLLEPIQIKDRFEEGKLIAGSRHDYYWLNEALQKNLPVLTETNPIGVVSVAEKQLIKAIDFEHDPKIDDNAKSTRSYWRLSISPRSDENHESDLKNLLVNTIILALGKACEQNRDQAPQIVRGYIDGEYSIFRRIGNYTLRTWGKQYPELLERAYFQQKKAPIIGWQSEFNRLVEIQFNNLPEFAKKDVLYERKNPDLRRVEDFLKNYPDRINGASEDEKKQTLIEEWQVDNLTPIATFLEGEDKDYYEKLIKKYGKPAPRPEEGVIVTSWEGPESPIKIDEFSKKSINEVVQYLLDYVPTNRESFGTPSREGLGRTLEIDVQARANDYANNADLFINENLPSVYHTYFFGGLQNAVKNKEEIGLGKVIALSEFIVDQNQDKFQKQQSEEGLGLPSAKLAVVHLLEELFRGRDSDIENELLGRSGEIIVKLLHQEEPFPDNEQAQGYDPATHSLNCIHGVAMHSLVSYGLYCERKRKKEMGEEGTPIMIPLMKEILNEKLDKTKNPSLAVHSVLGWYFPQFIYLDKEWALENREKIFPVETEMVRYWQAAWNAYIRFSDVYTNVFPELKKQYRRALEEFPKLEAKQGLGRSDQQMATHILKAYLLDMIKLDSEDGLISLYYQKADDETRSQGNFWLSQVLGAQQPSADDKLWQKIWRLWQWRIEIATASDDKSKFLKEISDFSRLLKSVPLDLSQILPVLEKTLEFNPKGFEIEEIIKYLGKNCEKYPDLAVLLLHKIVLSNQIVHLLPDAKGEVERMLTLAMDADNDSRAKAIEIINIFGELGDYSWRSLLDRK